MYVNNKRGEEVIMDYVVVLYEVEKDSVKTFTISGVSGVNELNKRVLSLIKSLEVQSQSYYILVSITHLGPLV